MCQRHLLTQRLIAFETTASTLAATAHYMSGSSEAYRRVANEVRSTFTCKGEIRLGPKLNSCVFLRACVDESMRLSPIAGAAPFREVEAPGIEVAGEFIPAGCDIGVATHTIHRNPKYWADPLQFKPERWLAAERQDVTRESNLNRSKKAYAPFSLGPRACVGRSLALSQIMLLFARLFWEFDFRRAGADDSWLEQDVNPEEFIMKDYVTAQTTGPVLCFRPRE
jgi:cytochrome P450